MNKMKKIILGAATLLMLVGCGGVNNNISFSLNSGGCADGTANAPYCMAVTIQNNAGGQNFITSTNFPIQNLSFSVTGPNNVNYPVGSGSAMDPNGCVSSTVAPGGTCTFYLQLTGESAPVGPKVPVTVNVSYTINNTLFGGSNTTASSSFTVYEYPAVVISSQTGGNAQRYTNNTIYPVYNAESAAINPVANAQDNYYGFLYLIGNGNIFASGTESFSYNITTESGTTLSNINNMLTIGNTLYPIVNNGTIYSSRVNPLSSITWSLLYSAVITPTITPNQAVFGINNFYVTNNGQVFSCSLNSGSSQSGCSAEGVSTTVQAGLGSINVIAYSPLGSGLTGLVIGTTTGLYAESGSSNSPSNLWSVVSYNSLPITNSVAKIVSDSNQNLYIADSNNNIYQLSPGSGTTAKLLTNMSISGTNQIQSMVYDNAGNVLYVATPNAIYGCFFESVNNFNCGDAPVTSTSITSALGMNIITSLLSN